jgi:hypothetical protein
MNSTEVEQPGPASPLGEAPAPKPARPKPIVTVAEINEKNKVAWDAVNPAPPPPDPLAILRADVLRLTVRAAVEETARARKATDAANRAKGTANSIKMRGDNTGRRRLVHDLHDSGRTPQQSHGDSKLLEYKEVTLTTIYRDLKAPRP